MNQSGLFKKIIGLLTLVLLLLFGVVYFVYEDIKSKNEKILEIEHTLNFKNTEYDYLVSMSNFIKNSETEINKINTSIIPVNGDVEFIENLEARARDNSLKIEIQSLNIVSNDTKTATSTVSTLRVKAKAEGTWQNIYTYINEIESLPYKVKINKLSLISNYTAASGGGTSLNDNKNWQATFEISVLKYQ